MRLHFYQISRKTNRSIHDPTPPRTKAMRKVVRLIIEKEGVDGTITKKDIYARYPKGRVLWKDVRVAQWDEGSEKMVLFGKLSEWQTDHDKLMGNE